MLYELAKGKKKDKENDLGTGRKQKINNACVSKYCGKATPERDSNVKESASPSTVVLLLRGEKEEEERARSTTNKPKKLMQLFVEVSRELHSQSHSVRLCRQLAKPYGTASTGERDFGPSKDMTLRGVGRRSFFFVCARWARQAACT